MEVVLLQDYGKLGKAQDVAKVKDGYARNFLIPQGIAVPATEGNKKVVAEAKRLETIRDAKKIEESNAIAKKIEETSCTIAVKVGEEDKIFGSVTAQEIAEFLKKEGYDIEKRNVELDEPIKQLGVYNVKVTVFKSVHAMLKVWVVKEEK